MYMKRHWIPFEADLGFQVLSKKSFLFLNVNAPKSVHRKRDAVRDD